MNFTPGGSTAAGPEPHARPAAHDAALPAAPAPPWRDVWRDLVPLAAGHRRPFLTGLALTVLGIGAQLALPWPLKALLALWSDTRAVPSWTQALPSAVPPAAVLVLGFLALMFAAGFLDHAQRLQFARFAIGWSRNIRAAATIAALRVSRSRRGPAPGDLVVRLISDVARFKAGVKILLVYVASNLCLLVGATVIVCVLSPLLGTVFAAATLAATAIAAMGSRGTRHAYLEHRRQESLLAGSLDGLSGALPEDAADELNRTSARYEVDEVRRQGLATWAAHAVVGLAVFAGIMLGADLIATDRIEPAALLVFLAYALLVAKPLVRLTRHGTRTGRVLACAGRLQQLIALTNDGPGRTNELPPLRETLTLTGLALPAGAASSGVGQLEVSRGERLALLGSPGSGKSALLALLCGEPSVATGCVRWDGLDIGAATDAALARRVGFLHGDPVWKPIPLREVLQLPDGDPEPAAKAVLRDLGVLRLVRKLPDGLDTPIASSHLAPGESRLVWLARLLIGRADLLGLDDPVAGLDRERAADVVEVIERESRGRTVVCAFGTSTDWSWCDRAISLDDGDAGASRPSDAGRSA